MPSEAGSPEAWLEYARSDLALAQQPRVPAVRWEPLCFHAQQAVEKAIKAVLLQHGVEFHAQHRTVGRLAPGIHSADC